MTGDTRTMKISDDEPWFVLPRSASREIERAAARARPPHIRVHNADQFRRDVLQHIDDLARLDVTAAERAETERWRQRIADAPSDRVWVEYQSPQIDDDGSPQ